MAASALDTNRFERRNGNCLHTFCLRDHLRSAVLARATDCGPVGSGAELPQLDQGALSFSDIIAPHNEHRIPLTRLAFLTDFIFFQGRSRLIYPLVLLAHVGLGAAIGLVATRGLGLNERVFGAATGVAFFVATGSPDQKQILPLPLAFARYIA